MDGNIQRGKQSLGYKPRYKSRSTVRREKASNGGRIVYRNLSLEKRGNGDDDGDGGEVFMGGR